MTRTTATRRVATIAIGAAVSAAVLPGTATTQTPAPPDLRGDALCAWGSADCTPPVRDLVGQFRSLRDHGDVLGYRMGRAPDVSMLRHWQGIQRLAPGRGRYVAVSRSGGGVSFVIVRMGSRGTDGHRFRSNRLGTVTALTPPPAEDTVVTWRASDPGFDHSGGMQAVGNHLAVGLEQGARSRVVFWDVSNPESPRRTGHLDHTTGVRGAGTVSLARLRNGRYLLVVGGTNANALDVYVSTRPGLLNPEFTHVTTWRESELRTEIAGDREFGNYQNVNLVTDTDGTLHLVGTHRDSVRNRDWTDLYRVSSEPGRPFVVTKIAKRHLYCSVVPGLVPTGTSVRPVGGTQCNLDAAGGVYVTPANRLVVYATEHDNDGPGGSVKLEEFRTAPHAGTCPTVRDAWVELYDDSGFDGDRGVMIDGADRTLRRHEDLDRVDRFGDKASAGRWCLPRGWSVRLHPHSGPCRGTPVTLVGTGRPAQDPDFDDGRGPVRRFGDTISCVTWVAP